MAYSFAGPVMNPWNNLDENHKEWFKSNEKKLNERTSMWFDIHPNPFKCPIPCLSSENFSHVSREEFFEFSQIQVLQHSPRVGAGHTDFGFGWLYVVKGIKLLLFVEEMTRKVASTDPHTRGCSIHSTWDLDVLSRLNNVKYFILQPGSHSFQQVLNTSFFPRMTPRPMVVSYLICTEPFLIWLIILTCIARLTPILRLCKMQQEAQAYSKQRN